MVDLHIHTNCSDGTKDWKFILREAERLGLSHISITDHNNCDVYFKMKNPGKYFSGKIISGVEPECYYKGRLIELLGYGFDVKKMAKLLKGVHRPFSEVADIKLRFLHETLVKMGAKFSDNILDGYTKQSKYYYSSCYLLADMKKYPDINRKFVHDQESWDDGIKFFRKHMCDKDSPLYFDHSTAYPSAEKIHKLIKQAGGKVFIPHIFMFEEDSVPFLESLVKEFDIDGVECYYPKHTKEQTKFLLEFCKKNNLLVSAGSDFHGKPNYAKSIGTKVGANDVGWVEEY